MPTPSNPPGKNFDLIEINVGGSQVQLKGLAKLHSTATTKFLLVTDKTDDKINQELQLGSIF